MSTAHQTLWSLSRGYVELLIPYSYLLVFSNHLPERWHANWHEQNVELVVVNCLNTKWEPVPQTASCQVITGLNKCFKSSLHYHVLPSYWTIWHVQMGFSFYESKIFKIVPTATLSPARSPSCTASRSEKCYLIPFFSIALQLSTFGNETSGSALMVGYCFHSKSPFRITVLLARKFSSHFQCQKYCLINSWPIVLQVITDAYVSLGSYI